VSIRFWRGRFNEGMTNFLFRDSDGKPLCWSASGKRRGTGLAGRLPLKAVAESIEFEKSAGANMYHLRSCRVQAGRDRFERL